MPNLHNKSCNPLPVQHEKRDPCYPSPSSSSACQRGRWAPLMRVCSVAMVVAARHRPSPTLQNPKVGSNGGLQRGNPIVVCWGRAFAIFTSRVAGP